jgi:two-component system cell cycle response regulator DivK
MPRLLLIEDNPTNQDLISRYLRVFDFDVVSACDGPSGLQTARDEHETIHAILMDMNLPEMDGWELARRLKADKTTADLPLIALTAHAMTGDREKAIAAGCDEYATKPINFPDLFLKIETLIQRARE